MLARRFPKISSVQLLLEPRWEKKIRTEAVAARVPPKLRDLSLDFTGCNIGAAGARAVAKKVRGIETIV